MASDHIESVNHEDIVINDDEIVLPSEPVNVVLRCRESWGVWEDIPEEVRVCIEEMGITWEDFEYSEFQNYDTRERGSINSLCSPSKSSSSDLTLSS